MPVGLLGATAFNPDHGVVLHSLVLWRIFGLMFEVGAPLLLIMALLTALASALKRFDSPRP